MIQHRRGRKHRHRWVWDLWLNFEYCDGCTATREKRSIFYFIYGRGAS